MKVNRTSNFLFTKSAKGGLKIEELLAQTNANKAADGTTPVTLSEYKYALILIGLGDSSNNFSEAAFSSKLKNLIQLLVDSKVVPILQTINDFRDEDGRKATADAINKAIIAVAGEKKIPYVDTRDYIKVGHMTKDGFHYNTKTYGPSYCIGTGSTDSCDPTDLDAISDDLNSPTTGHGIRNAILREAIRKIEKELEPLNQSIVVTANTSGTSLKPLTLFGVQAQTASESIISILQSYGSSGYLCYDFGGLSCVPATLSTIEGRAVRVDVTVDKSYPAKPICVSRTNSCNGGIFLDPNL